MVGKEEKYYLVKNELKNLFITNYLSYRMVKCGIEIDYPNRERYVTVFSNSKIEITFSYTERNIRDEVFDNFNISISKDEYHFFNFVTFLKTIGIKDPEEKMKLINYEGDFIECLDKFCEFVKNIFDKHLKKVISGEEWINVNFDWGPYK